MPEIGERIEVIDNVTGECVRRGICTSRKMTDHEMHYLGAYSIDDRHYFSTVSGRFTVRATDDPNDMTDPPLNGYRIYKWSTENRIDPEKWDIFRDYSYDEIDAEVAPLVHELNEHWHGLRTIQSCCGHGRSPLWVKIYVSDIQTLMTISAPLKLSEGPLCRKFNISIGTGKECDYANMLTHPSSYDYRKDTGRIPYKTDDVVPEQLEIGLVIFSKTIGEDAYRDAELYRQTLEDMRRARQTPR